MFVSIFPGTCVNEFQDRMTSGVPFNRPQEIELEDGKQHRMELKKDDQVWAGKVTQGFSSRGQEQYRVAGPMGTKIIKQSDMVSAVLDPLPYACDDAPAPMEVVVPSPAEIWGGGVNVGDEICKLFVEEKKNEYPEELLKFCDECD